MKYTDDEILEGFRAYDKRITKEYFYGYCRRAYNVLDNRYDLKNKVGMDFFSLAHEYYISLMIHKFKPLADRPKTMKLSAYMFKGFWFVAMDALKAHKLEFAAKSTSDVDDVLRYVRSSDHEEGMMEQVVDAVAHHYKDDKMTKLAYDFFVLGCKQKEISAEWGLTPSAINQRYKKMMDEVVTPFIIENYSSGIYAGTCEKAMSANLASFEMDYIPSTSFMVMRNMVTYPTTISHEDMDKRTTPAFITSLKENEIFVFGSNLQGIHAGGAARMALEHFGAVMGNGVGLQGQSYAIPTMQGGVETIKPYVDEFIRFAKEHEELTFLVTPIGCGIAGFDVDEIAPLFREAIEVENIHLPEEFWG